MLIGFGVKLITDVSMYIRNIHVYKIRNRYVY